ncbi:hypothetical protein ACP4OV_003609 [Aristida adscensionis]
MRMLSDSPAAVDASTAPLLATPAAASASPAGGSGGGGFDASMVFILAALLCVLVCALGINSLARCALHCGRRTLAVAVAGAGAAPPPAAARPATTAACEAGLGKRQLRRIPVAVYESSTGVPGAECAICLGELADGEKVRVLPRCHHGFHVQCIDAWLAAHSSCPICRSSLAEDAGAGEATAAGEAT